MWPFPKAGRGILRHPRSLLNASHQVLRGVAMRELLRREFRQILFLMASILAIGASCAAQQPEGPQSDAPPPVAPKPAQEQPPGSGEKITVPAGTRVGRSEEHTSELQSRLHLVCRLLLEKKKNNKQTLSSQNKKNNKNTQ